MFATEEVNGILVTATTIPIDVTLPAPIIRTNPDPKTEQVDLHLYLGIWLRSYPGRVTKVL